jgi:hypothetical protein
VVEICCERREIISRVILWKHKHKKYCFLGRFKVVFVLPMLIINGAIKRK